MEKHLLTLREAARRVMRSELTVQRWQAAWMVTGWKVIEGQRARVVGEDVVLAWWRDRLDAWPAHRYLLRKAMRNRERKAQPGSRPPASTQAMMSERAYR